MESEKTTDDVQSGIFPEGLRPILDYIKAFRGIDFNAYRPATIRRRIAFRLRAASAPDYTAYYEYLRTHPREIEELIDVLTIKVSHFFRNPFVFEVLKDFVLPELVETGRKETLRVWCAGCARGEEPYSLAILLRELFHKEAVAPPVSILATDIDRQALEGASRALYDNEALIEVKKGYLDRYFRKQDGLWSLSDEIKAMAVFAYHDVTTGRPPREGIFSDYHLILCRNLLIYYDRGTHEKVTEGLYRCLRPGGYLVLGEAETIPSGFEQYFVEVVPRSKVFRKGGPW